MFRSDPPAAAGQSVGLLGGSFDPPHSGHLHISRQALATFRLDRVWWLVSPGNPLKPDAPASLDRRVGVARGLVSHPRVTVTDIEASLRTRYTADTIGALQRRYRGVRFVWLMGADNLSQFHHWEDWAGIMQRVPVGVLARPGEQLRAGLSPAARRFARWRLPAAEAGSLAHRDAPCWTMVWGPMKEVSSTELREAGAWERHA